MATITSCVLDGDTAVVNIEVRVPISEITDGVGSPLPGTSVQIPVKFPWSALASLIAASRRDKLQNTYNFIRAIDRRDKTAAATALSAMVTDNTIIASERTAIINFAQSTMTSNSYANRVRKSDANIKAAIRDALMAEVS